MMKRYKLITSLLTLLLVALVSVSCSKDDMEEVKDERLPGTWELEEILCHVDTSDDYFQSILEDMIVTDGTILYHAVFRDTIQIEPNGFFLETGSIEEESIYPYYTVKNDELFVTTPMYGTTNIRRADYEFPDADILVLTVNYTDEFNVLKTHLLETGEYDSEMVSDLIITGVTYTQIYRKIINFPYDIE